MDPWGGNTSSEGTSSSSQENIFDDSFTAEKSDGRKKNELFEKLPDSEEYLAVLETKLKNLKKKKVVLNKEEIVGELLLRSNNSRLEIVSDSDIELDSAVANNQLVRQILPQQPISRGETVRLLQADYLGEGYTKSLQKEDTSLSD